MIYHDLRSPLANVLSSLDLMATFVPEGSNPSLEMVISIASRSTQRIQRLVSSLLDIHKLEAGQPVASQETAEPQTLIQEALEILQSTLMSKRQVVNLAIEPDLPALWVDADMIRRVLVNLLDNASKFSPEDSQIVVGAIREGEQVRLWVQDAGPGIPESMHEDIFNKFTRLRTRSAPKGLGLGLAFCRLAVGAHGGEIWVESLSEAGSKFQFTLPVAVEDEARG
jgi:two-component system, NtrC family, sensor histidine kinase KinB